MSMSNEVDVVNVVLLAAQPQPPRGEGFVTNLPS